MKIFLLYISFKIIGKCSDVNDIKHYDAEKILNEQEVFGDNSFVYLSNDDCEEYIEFLDQIELSINNNSDDLNVMTNSLLISNFNKYVTELYININSYIKKNIPKCNSYVYIQRLNLSYNIIQKCTTNTKEVFSADIDKDYTLILNDLKLEFKNQFEINNEKYEKFIDYLDRRLKEVFYKYKKRHMTLYGTLHVSSNLYLIEFMKIYKYVKVFPELLCLGYVDDHTCFKNVIILLHLTGLFLLQNENNLRENRTIFLFLWIKIISHTKKKSIDIFSILKFRNSNCLDISHCYFFSFEFENYQRRKIKRRMNYYDDQCQSICEDDRPHYNVVLRLYLFQHLIYLKYTNAKNCVFEEFKAFCECVLEEESFYRNRFYQFLDIIKS